MPRWSKYPRAWIDPARLYTRQEIAERAGLTDDVLSFWIKRRLLEHEEGGEGKGSHRRFHYSQVNVAVILAVFRDNFGSNIATLLSLAKLLQSAVRTFKHSPLHIGDWTQAARIGDLLHRFRNGDPVMVDAHDFMADGYEKLPPEERHRKRPAKSEAEVIADIRWISDRDPSGVIRAAEALGPGHEVDARIALVVLGVVLDPSYMGDIYWLLMQTDDGWVIREGSDESVSDLSDLGPALFLPVVPLLKRAWGIPNSRTLMRERQAQHLQEKLEAAGISATIVANELEDDGFRIDAPDADWKLVERVLTANGYRMGSNVVEAQE
jgi:DNA-binding transcriptional MerR regulator